MSSPAPAPSTADDRESADFQAPASPARSYGQILKSSALIGGSSVATLAVNIARAKTMALLLGPSGVGLMGLYASIFDFSQSIAGMGVNSSGVRQIAEAHATGDAQKIARTSAVLSRTSIGLGVVGGLSVAALSPPIALWTFGNVEAAWGVAALALAVLLRSISDGQSAAIQGMRRISDLARKGVISAVASSMATVLLVIGFGATGIVPSLVATAAITLLVSWWYRRKIELPPAGPLTVHDIRTDAGPLLRLGLAFMASAVLTTGAAYVVRIIVRDHAGIDAAGLYQSAWAIGGIYVAFILQAMGSDFYPRLTSVANDHAACNRLVNEQAEIGLLLAGPGVIATLALAPLIISVLYHSTFVGAVEPLRWICIGMALRVVAWPMGYIILAKGARRMFFLTEVAAAVVHISLAAILVPRLGVIGATMAFAGLYVWHSVFVFVLVRRLTGFAWSTANLGRAATTAVLVTVVFVVCALAPASIAIPFGALVAAGSGVHSVRELARLVPMQRAPRFVQVVLQKCRLVSAPA